MMESPSTTPTEKLSQSIEGVVRNATNQIEAFDKSQFVRSRLPTAFLILLLVPLIAVGCQLLRWYFGFAASPVLSWWAWGILTVLAPVGWLFSLALSRQFQIARLRALRITDQELGATERLETADDFLKQPAQDGFMEAAIEDAAQWARRGQSIELKTQYIPQASYSVLWPIPAAALLLVLAFLLSSLEGSKLEPVASTAKAASATDVASPEPTKPRKEITPPPEQPKEEPPQTKPEDRSNKAVNRQGSAAAAIPDTAEESSGKLSEGETRESQQSANPSNAKGSPSASGQPSKSGDESKKKKKPPKKTAAKEREKKERPQEEKPSGATSGQGSSKGSDNNAAPSDWASTSQSATPDDEDLEEEDEVDDEEEEQESRGGVQPNMRDRRTPVNRDLQIGFGSNRPNPDANGRGGPGGQKKSRGVASLVLGVPIPDRVNGQPNKGRIRITQQRITPETEISEPQAAEARPERNGTPGKIHRPQFTPWLHDYVRRYFLEQRAKHPLNPPVPSGSTSDSNDPQSTSNTDSSSTSNSNFTTSNQTS